MGKWKIYEHIIKLRLLADCLKTSTKMSCCDKTPANSNRLKLKDQIIEIEINIEVVL